MKRKLHYLTLRKAAASLGCLGLLASAATLIAGTATNSTTVGNITWDLNNSKSFGGNGTALWTNNADVVKFDKSGGPYYVNVNNLPNGQVGCAGLIFGNVAGNWIFTNQLLQIGAQGIAQTLANANTGLIFSNDVQMAAAQTWSINAARPLKMWGALTGNGPLTFDALGYGGTLTLGGANSFTGAMVVTNAGNLTLDYVTMGQSNAKLDPASPLYLGPGTVTLNGASGFTETVSGLNLMAGGSALAWSGANGIYIQLNGLNRSNYTTLSVGTANLAMTSSANDSSDILGGWASCGPSWAQVNGWGAIAGYDGTATGGKPNAANWGTNENININNTFSNLTSQTVNALRLGGPSLVDLTGATLTLNDGGLMAANNNPTLTNGYLQSGLASGELFVHTLNGQNLTNYAVIQDNSSNGVPTALVKAGANTLVIGASNTYSGPTYVNAGSLQLSSGAALASSPVTLNPGSGNLLNNGTILAVTVNGGTLSNNGLISSNLTLNLNTTIANNGSISNAVLNAGILANNGAVSNALVNTGSTLTNNGVISGAVRSGVSTSSSSANVVNNSVIGGSLSIDPGSGPALPQGAIGTDATTGNALLNGGSSTGAIANNGHLTLAGTTPISLGTISGANTNGGILNNNTAPAGNTLTFADGSSFSFYKPGQNAIATFRNGGGTTSFKYFVYNTQNGPYSTTFDGGTWNLQNLGQNNTGCQNNGTNVITGGASIGRVAQIPRSPRKAMDFVKTRRSHFPREPFIWATRPINVAANGNYTHGIWNIVNGVLAFSGSVAEYHGPGVPLRFSVDNSGGGSGSSLLASGLTLGQASTTTNCLNTLSIGSGGMAGITGNLTLGANYNQTAETNLVTLAAGKLKVSGTIQAAASTYTGQNNLFAWNGGQLTAQTITPSAGFSSLSQGISPTTLTNNGAVGTTLAPGDIGTPGRTTINGNYWQGPNGALAIDVGGTGQASGFTNLPSFYDTVMVASNVVLNGQLVVNLINGFEPAPTDTFVIVATTNLLSGTFANLDGRGRVAVAGNANASFHVTISSTNVVLDNYQGAVVDVPPVASFTSSPTFGVRPLLVTFTDTSSGSITNLLWQFGDASSTNVAVAGGSVIHTYRTEGTYTVTLTASGPGGFSASNRAVVVTAPDSPRLTSLKPSGAGVTVQGMGGPASSSQTYYYVLLSSINVSAALSNWTPVATNAFNPDGSFSNSLPVTPGEPKQFYLMQMP